MRKALAAALAALVLVLAAGAQDYRYVRSTMIVSQNRVLVKSISDFLDFVRARKIDTIFALDPQGERIEEFYAYSDGLFYSIKANGYPNLADYAAGGRVGFQNGAEFTAARELGIANKDEYDYWSSERFLSVRDMKAAIAAGFRGKGREVESYVFPRLVPDKAYEGAVLDALVFASLMEGVSVPLNQSAKDLALKHGIKLPGVGSSLSLSVKGGDRERSGSFAPFLREYILKEGKVGKLEYRRIDRGYASAEVVKFAGTGSDASLWYFSRIFGDLRHADFGARYTVLASGYDSKQDEAAAVRAGFLSSDDYYAALSTGFGDARDFLAARTLGVADAKAWQPIKDRLKDIYDAMNRTGLTSFSNGVVAYFIATVLPGKSVAVERLVELANGYFDVNKDIRKLFGDKLSSSSLAETLAGTKEFSRLGEWDAENKVFMRK